MSHHASVLPEATTRPLLRAGPGARLERSAARGAAQVLIVLVGIHLAFIVAQSNLELMGRIDAFVAATLATVAALAASLSRRPMLRAAGAIGFGLMGLAAGLGVAPVWLLVAGPSPTAVFAAAGAVAALCLLAYGLVAFVVAIPGWWRLVVIPLAFVLVQFVLVPLTGAVYGTHPPRTPLSASMPDGAERVTFTTDDGVAHVAWYWPSRNGAVVVLLPGSGGDKGSTVMHGTRLAGHGFGVLALDSRGTGESGGNANAWGWGGDVDVRAAVDWLSERPEIRDDGVGLLGLSMGGEIAITAAATDSRIQAIVAEGVSARVPEDLGYLPGDVAGMIQRIEGQIMWEAGELMTDAVAPWPLIDLVPEVESRLLLVVGNDPAEAAAAPRLLAAAPSIASWTLPDAPHTQALATHPEGWEHRVVEFLADRLRVDTSGSTVD